jgi:hypothetical protein
MRSVRFRQRTHTNSVCTIDVMLAAPLPHNLPIQASALPFPVRHRRALPRVAVFPRHTWDISCRCSLNTPFSKPKVQCPTSNVQCQIQISKMRLWTLDILETSCLRKRLNRVT